MEAGRWTGGFGEPGAYGAEAAERYAKPEVPTPRSPELQAQLAQMERTFAQLERASMASIARGRPAGGPARLLDERAGRHAPPGYLAGAGGNGNGLSGGHLRMV